MTPLRTTKRYCWLTPTTNIRNADVSIRLVSSAHNTITHNTGTVQLENSFSNTITDVNGILIEQSSNDNIISNNTLTNNYQGIHLSGSSSNTLRNNRMIDNKNQFFVSSPDRVPSNFVHHVDTSNTVNGKPIYYWINRRWHGTLRRWICSARKLHKHKG